MLNRQRLFALTMSVFWVNACSTGRSTQQPAADVAATTRECPDLAGKYVIQGEDGQVVEPGGLFGGGCGYEEDLGDIARTPQMPRLSSASYFSILFRSDRSARRTTRERAGGLVFILRVNLWD